MPAARAARHSVVVAFVTCPSRTVARRLAARLVQARVAACVNLVSGVDSVFRWAGKVDRARETLLIIKTTRPRLEALRRRVVRLHPYDVPEFIAVPVAAGHAPYLRWVRSSVAGPSRRQG